MQKILVISSTGKVGSELIPLLANAGEHVRAATRNPASLTASSNIEPVRFDFEDRSTFAPALAGVDRVFLIEPQPPLAGPSEQFMIPFVEAVAEARAKIVFLSSASVDFDSNDPLLKVEKAITASGGPYVILRSNWFMDNFHTLWLGPILEAGIIPVPAADSRISFIDTRDIAAAATAALCSDRFDRQVLTLTGPTTLNFYEAVQAISAVSGRSVTYVPIDDVAFRQSLLATGLPPELVDYLSNIFAHTRRGLAAAVTPAIEDLCGRPPHTFADYASHRADVWK